MFAHEGEGLVDVVGDFFELDFSVFDDGVAGPGVAVAGLADAAGVDDAEATGFDLERDVCVANAEKVGLDRIYFLNVTSPAGRLIVKMLRK